MTRRRRTYILVCMTILSFTFSFIATSTSGSDETKENESSDRIIAAKVNGEPIYKEELTPYAEQEAKKFRKYGMTRKESPELVKRMERRALDKIISEKLLIQASRQVKIEDIDKKVDERVQKLKTKYRNEEHFKSYLDSKKLTENDLRENLRRNMIVEKHLAEKGIQNPEIPEEEIKGFYEESKDNFRTDEYVRASHILIKVDENASGEQRDAARKKAEKIRADIVNGKDFAEMAREFSEDGRAANNGNLDYITRGYMPPEFDSVAFAMNKDEVSDVVQTKFGFHIIKVFDKKPAGIPPYDEMRSFIEKYLQKELTRKKLDSYVEELRSKAKIEVLID